MLVNTCPIVAKDISQPARKSNRIFQVSGCVVTSRDMVENKDSAKVFDKIIEGIPNATAVQLDVQDHVCLCNYISQVDVVISLLPPSCHVNACLELRRHLVTASYVDHSLSMLDEKAKLAGITILGYMGLDPGIAANNPLANKFSWNPAGAIRAGRNPATYRSKEETVHVGGDNLYDSAVRFRIPDLPAFALECLPNRNSLIYGDLYVIADEASTIFCGTLHYEGFGEIMGTLARIGLFNTEPNPLLKDGERPTFGMFLPELLKIKGNDINAPLKGQESIAESIVSLGYCKDQGTALKAAKTIIFLGLQEQTEILVSCQSAFDVSCFRMRERLAYSGLEQDMVLLHHEVEVDFPDDQEWQNHHCHGPYCWHPCSNWSTAHP